MKSVLSIAYVFVWGSASMTFFRFRFLIRWILLRLRHTKTLLLLAGFEHVAEMDGLKFFRKRK